MAHLLDCERVARAQVVDIPVAEVDTFEAEKRVAEGRWLAAVRNLVVTLANRGLKLRGGEPLRLLKALFDFWDRASSYGMSAIGIVIAPSSAPQLPAGSRPQAPQTPVLNALDRRLRDVVGEHESIRVTSVLNFLTSEQAPKNRSEERTLWLDAWHRLRRLLRLGLIFRADRTSVSLLKPISEVRPPPDISRKQKPTVRANDAEHRASTETLRTGATLRNPFEEPQNQLRNAQPRTQFTSQPPDKTQCASASGQIASAARSLAMLPRRPKRKWTGWIGRTRAYKNMRIVLPTAETAFVAGVLRGRCVFTFDEGRLIGGFDGEPFRWGVVSAREVQVLKNPAAQQLAALKRGVKERPSEKKKAACRINALKPPRPGSKPRGRPRTALLPTKSASSQPTMLSRKNHGPCLTLLL